MADLYEELGVARDASEKQIRQAYRRRAKKEHPDTGGSPEAFERLQLAHLVLTDQKRRADYDRTGECDEPAPDQSESDALSLIAGAVMRVLDADFDPLACDLRAKMAERIGASMEHVRGQLEDVPRVKARAEKIIGRFKKRSPGEPIIDSMLRGFADQLGKTEAPMRESLRAHERALEILKDYDFKADPPERGSEQNPFRGMSLAEAVAKMRGRGPIYFDFGGGS